MIDWAKAQSCGGSNGCVEVALHEGRVLVRDSEDPDGAVLAFQVKQWASFIVGAKNGEFDFS
ncbi:MAG TPA: DUF397 domain-containing protein [Micromonosporaceae bacterium]|nr:DUF397 domain-containing protein [Micromonosporaceae bacterium]